MAKRCKRYHDHSIVCFYQLCCMLFSIYLACFVLAISRHFLPCCLLGGGGDVQEYGRGKAGDRQLCIGAFPVPSTLRPPRTTSNSHHSSSHIIRVAPALPRTAGIGTDNDEALVASRNRPRAEIRLVGTFGTHSDTQHPWRTMLNRP